MDLDASLHAVRAVYFAVYHLVRAVLAPLQRDSFLYWPFLLSAVLLAAGAWAYWRRGRPGRSWGEFRARYLGARLWWHPSARADYRLYLVNALLFPATLGLLLLGPDELARRLDALLGLGGVTAAASGGLSPAWALAFTLVFFVAYDFGRYLAHSALHRSDLLWEFHKVHHAAEVLTPITAFRAHPVDLFVMAWGSALTTALATWAFNHLAGAQVGFVTFLGLHALLWLSNLIGNLNHSPVWFTFGPRLGKWLISPAHHQLHHSCEARHMGCNRGFALAVWDRLFGTLYVPSGPEERYVMGLGDGSTAQWHSVRHMLLAPFANVARRLFKR